MLSNNSATHIANPLYQAGPSSVKLRVLQKFLSSYTMPAKSYSTKGRTGQEGSAMKTGGIAMGAGGLIWTLAGIMWEQSLTMDILSVATFTLGGLIAWAGINHAKHSRVIIS